MDEAKHYLQSRYPREWKLVTITQEDGCVRLELARFCARFVGDSTCMYMVGEVLCAFKGRLDKLFMKTPNNSTEIVNELHEYPAICRRLKVSRGPYRINSYSIKLCNITLIVYTDEDLIRRIENMITDMEVNHESARAIIPSLPQPIAEEICEV